MSRKKTYKFLKRKLNDLRKIIYPPLKPKHATVNVELGDNSAIVYVGDLQFSLSTSYEKPLHHEVYDFAMYGALAIAFTKNWALSCDLPISRSCAESLEKLCLVVRVFYHKDMYVQPLTLSNIVDDPVDNGAERGIICMSGGVDSTYAGLELKKEQLYTHGLLMAGADYPSANAPGFVDLKNRVENICNTFDMSLIVVDSTIRSTNVNWDMTHAICLTMAMQFHSTHFNQGAIAADLTPAQEVTMGPWGNNLPITDALSKSTFPLSHAGSAMFRSDKLGAIMEKHPELMEQISVCYMYKDSGENCGECRKCVRTMLSLYSLGHDFKDYFLTEKELLTLMKDPPQAPDSISVRHVIMSWYVLEEARLPEGEIKEALGAYVKKLADTTPPHE